jgi:hypothetical protein
MSLCRAQRRVFTQTATMTVKTLTKIASNCQDRFLESLLKISTRGRSKYIVPFALVSIVSKSVQTRATANLSSLTTSGRTLLNLRTSSKLGRTTQYSRTKTIRIKGFSNGESRIHRIKGSIINSKSSNSLGAKGTTKILWLNKYLSRMSTSRGMPTWDSLRYKLTNRSRLITRLGDK